MTITKREVICSIVIICIMAVIGLLIGEEIDEQKQVKSQEYNQALRIRNDSEQFGYAMRTSAGNAFVYGDLEAVEPVRHKNIEGIYAYIREIREEYRMHIRTYTTTDSKGRRQTHTQVYYSWDAVDEKIWHCDHLRFCGYDFDYDQIGLPEPKYVDMSYESSKVRFVYSASDEKYTGTLYAKAAADTIVDAKFYSEMDIDQTIKYLESGKWKTVFVILWSILTAAAVFGFCYLDNEWLED